MPTDILTLGPVDFVNFSPPEKMPAGGEQRLATHKLLGGGKQVDRLGPDDKDRSWSGFFLSGEAFATCQVLDALRSAGDELVLSWAEETRLVTIGHFDWEVRRYPQLIDYSITVVCSDNNGGGGLGGFLFDAASLILNDLASAVGL